MAEKKEFNWLELGILTALMFQTHVFTSLILILIYLPFFCYAFIKNPKKSQLLKKLACSIGLFFLLTLAIWASFYMIYSTNTIADPFINQHMDRSAITSKGRYWLTTPIFLVVLLFGQLLISALLWKNIHHSFDYAVERCYFFSSYPLISFLGINYKEKSC
jgi:ATP/ADP translocase